MISNQSTHFFLYASISFLMALRIQWVNSSWFSDIFLANNHLSIQRWISFCLIINNGRHFFSTSE
jgi:hypothetical protein